MRLQELKDTVAEQLGGDMYDLVGMLELTFEDILDRFPDKLMDNQHKFGVEDREE